MSRESAIKLAQEIMAECRPDVFTKDAFEVIEINVGPHSFEATIVYKILSAQNYVVVTGLFATQLKKELGRPDE